MLCRCNIGILPTVLILVKGKEVYKYLILTTQDFLLNNRISATNFAFFGIKQKGRFELRLSTCKALPN